MDRSFQQGVSEYDKKRSAYFERTRTAIIILLVKKISMKLHV